MRTSLNLSPYVLAEWVGRLVRIPSVNPSQAPVAFPISGEQTIATQVAQWFQAFGGKASLEDVLENRPNVYGVWKGKTDRWLAVDVHLDTVGVDQMTLEPFSGEIRNDRVYGRGAADTKATLGILLAILEEGRRLNITPSANLLVVGTADEEVDGCGAPAFARWVREHNLPLQQLLVAEPTGCRPVYGHKGEVRMTFTVQGEAAHSSRPHLGKNAIVAAADLIKRLEVEHQGLQKSPAELPLSPATLAVTLIQGGTGLNVIPDACRVSVDRRTLPGEAADEIVKHLTEIGQESCELPVTAQVLSSMEAFYQPPRSPWLQQLAGWSNLEPGTVTFGTNAWAYKGLAEETVVMGPGSIEQAHGAEEWIEISELIKMYTILKCWLGL